MKKKVLLTLALTMAFAACLTGCGKSSTGTNGEVVVYNWGEYIDPDTLDQFEEETGIHVVYDEFETTRSCIRRWNPVQAIMMLCAHPIT